ncbi:uncharacterized protein RJT20DRAFT_98178 [Scheffersomyces xylosifermentans]|uniref:uncharacterized protein n=1 Tax=Scheffersomyces xylosifermentans TaxID=1304137 RepID=UPI00315C78BA
MDASEPVDTGDNEVQAIHEEIGDDPVEIDEEDTAGQEIETEPNNTAVGQVPNAINEIIESEAAAGSDVSGVQERIPEPTNTQQFQPVETIDNRETQSIPSIAEPEKDENEIETENQLLTTNGNDNNDPIEIDTEAATNVEEEAQAKSEEQQDEIVEEDVDQQEEPNTSLLQIPIEAQFTTPSKSLPPLKDIDHISTPKSFSVARDSSEQPTVGNSSPIIEKTRPIQNPLNDDSNNITISEDAIQAISGFLSIDEDEIAALNNPAIINALAKRAMEYHEVVSENSFLQLQQEQSFQNSSRVIDELKQKYSIADKSVSNLKSENESLTTTVSSQEHRIHELQEANKFLEDRIQRLSEEQSKAAEEYKRLEETSTQSTYKYSESINQLTSSNIDQSKRVNELTKELNEARNEKFSLKLELTKVNNEVSYLKNQGKWYDDELKSVQSRFTELIKKHESEYLLTSNKVSSLTSRNETLERMNKIADETLKELKSKLDIESNKFSTASSGFEAEKSKLLREIKSKDDLIELSKVQNEQKATRIDQLESYVDEIKEKLTTNIKSLESEVDAKTERIIELEEKLKTTEEVLDRELHKETELPKLTESSALIASQGMSLSSLYAEFSHLKKQLVLERSQKDKLALQLESFVNELESKKPIIANYRDQVQFYENSLKEMIGKVETIRMDKLEVEKDAERLRSRISENENDLVSMKKLLRDLGRQLCYYLIHSKIRDNDEDPLSVNERKAIDNILQKSGNYDNIKESDSDHLITERLVEFASIIELRQKNEDLLVAVRQLSKRLETKEEENNNIESVAVEEAKDAILTLESELDSISAKLDAVTQERDILKTISNNDGNRSINIGDSEYRYLKDANEDLREKLKDSERILKEIQLQNNTIVQDLNDKLRDVTVAKNQLSLQLSSTKHTAALAETRFANAQKSLESIKLETDQLRSDISFWKEQASKQEKLLISKSNEVRDLEASLSNNKVKITNLESERQFKDSISDSLKEEINQLRSDKTKLNEFVLNLQSLLKDREQSSKTLSERLNKSIENYQLLQEKVAEKEERILILSSQSELSLKAQNTKLEQVNEISMQLLQTKTKLVEKDTLVESLKQKVAELNASIARRPIAHIEHTGPTSGTSSSGNDSSKQGLQIEISQLKEDLKVSESQVNDLSNLAKASEAALINATNSFEAYKNDSESKYNALFKERQHLTEEIVRLNSALEDSTKEFEAYKNQHTNETNELKSKLNEYAIKADAYDTLENDFNAKLSSVSQDLERQVQINSNYQDKYNQELQRSNDLSREVETLKESISSHDLDIQTLRDQLSVAKSSLIVKEENMIAEKSSLEEELAATKSKLDELKEHNDLILNQLELNKPSVDNLDSNSSDELREVISFLRREKGAVEAKVIVLSEENKRLQQHLEQLNSEFAVTKSEFAKISATAIDLNVSSKEQSRLSEQIEQLSILRESNSTLRHENKINVERLNELNVQLQQAQSELEPLRARIEELTTEVEIGNQKLKLIEEENERLKNRVDPSTDSDQNALQAMREKIKEVRSTANARLQSQNETIKGLQASVTSLNEEIASLTSKSKANTSIQTDEVNKQIKAANEESLKQIDALTKEKNSLLAQIAQLRQHALKQTFEKEKIDLQNSLRFQFDKQLEEERKKNGASNENVEALRKKLDADFQRKYNSLEDSIKLRKLELEKSFEERVQQQVKTAAIKKLNEEFAKTLDEERAKTKIQMDNLYAVKIKMLNKKLEKLEAANSKKSSPAPNSSPTKSTQAPKQAQQPATGTPVALPSIPTSSGNNVSKVNKPLGYPFTESTLTVHRPAVDRPESSKTPVPQANANPKAVVFGKNNKQSHNQNQNHNQNQGTNNNGKRLNQSQNQGPSKKQKE